MVLSEYGIENVQQPVFVNRQLAESGDLQVQITSHGDILDVHRSRAFAVCDHQLAHVYVSDPADISRVRQQLSGVEGVDRVLDHEALKVEGLDHPRSGDLVLIAEPGCWFAYPWWLDESRAPDFARTVDIHRKPGFDPAELFLDPDISWPTLKVGLKLLGKKLGFRNLMDVISTDPRQVRGSHGRRVEKEANGPVLVRSWAQDQKRLTAENIFDEILAKVRGSV